MVQDWRSEAASSNFLRWVQNRKVSGTIFGLVLGFVIFMQFSSMPVFPTGRPIGDHSRDFGMDSGLLPKTGISHTFKDGTVYTRPKESKVMGVVFYGRWDRVQILDCYMKRNLVSNGGFLDGVIFVVNTKEKGDLEKLEALLASEPSYRKGSEIVHSNNDKLDFKTVWNDLAEDDTVFIKMDDDIVYIHDDTIPRLVQHRLAHPENFLISANVINNPLPSWIHWRLGAIQAFLPEQETPPWGWKPTDTLLDWRMSKMPKIQHSDKADKNEDFKTPAKPHRWLPLEGGNIEHTPIRNTEYNPYGPGWKDWRIAAQQHYSFFQNLEAGEEALQKYHFKEWDPDYKRISINMIAIFGKDLKMAKPMPRDDEQHLSVDIPKRTARHTKFIGDALAAHYSFGAQKKGLAQTDILERYRALAKETCGKLLD